MSKCYQYKIIQMHLGLRPFTMCIALAMAFAQTSLFYYKIYITPMRPGLLDHSKCVSNGYGLLASKNKCLGKFAYKNPIFLYKVYRPILVLKMCLAIGLVLSPIVFSKCSNNYKI